MLSGCDPSARTSERRGTWLGPTIAAHVPGSECKGREPRALMRKRQRGITSGPCFITFAERSTGQNAYEPALSRSRAAVSRPRSVRADRTSPAIRSTIRSRETPMVCFAEVGWRACAGPPRRRDSTSRRPANRLAQVGAFASTSSLAGNRTTRAVAAIWCSWKAGRSCRRGLTGTWSARSSASMTTVTARRQVT